MARHLAWILGTAVLCGAQPQASALCGPAAETPQADARGGAPRSDAPQPSPPAKPEHRPWKFWQGETQAELGITAQQAAEIEQIFQATFPKLEAAKDRIDKLEATLSKTIQDNTADLATVGQQVDRLEAARAELSKTRTLMLYRMRGVLTADQRTRLQALWEAGRGRGQAPPGRR